jgi:hypothetical protein
MSAMMALSAEEVAFPSPPRDVSPPPAAASDAADSETSSVNRTYEDLHFGRYLALVGGSCALRLLVQHPATLIIARKQACDVAARMSAVDVARQLFRKEGVTGFTAGMAVFLTGSALSEMIYLGLYEFSRAKLPLDGEASRDLWAGYMGDFSSRFIYTPALVVASRQMVASTATHAAAAAPAAGRGARAVVRAAYRSGGAKALFAGLGASIVVGSLSTGCWWVIYQQLKLACYALLPTAEGRRLEDRFPGAPRWLTDHRDNFVANSAASIVASAGVALAFYPFYVVRTRLQVSNGASFRRVIADIVRTQGPRGFMRGATLNLASCTFDGWLASNCYELAKYYSDRTLAA